MTECQKWKNNNKGKNCVGSRVKVMNGNALKTSGGLKKKVN